MPELFGQASWPGCLDFISCSYSYGHGTAPGVVSLVVCERDMKLAATYGDLKIFDGTNELILKDCKLSDVSAAGAGRYTLSIFDRRWKWEFPSITGQYNRRDNKNKLIPWQIQTLQHLVLFCKRAMGENEDTGDMPEVEEDDLPAVDWVFANAAQALTELAESFGCRVVFRPWENDTVICTAGIGADLPDLDYESYTPEIDLPEKPSKLAIIGGEIAYTCAFALEAVGIEPWGEIKPIDELSYTPADGWGTSPPPYFPNLTVPDINPGVGVFFPGIKIARLTAAEYRALAKSCVYKWYRITLNPLAGVKFQQPSLEGREFKDSEPIPGGGGARQQIHADRYFKLLGGILTTKRDDLGTTIVDPPRVHGVFNRGAANYWTNTAKTESVTEGITIDSERGLVKFDRYMFRLNPTASTLALAIFANAAGGSIDPYRVGAAELVLVCSCSVRDSITHQFERTQRLRVLDAPEGMTKEKIIHREEIQLIKYAEFDPSTWQVKATADNSEEVNAAANRYLDGAEKEYQFVQSATRKYAGILPVNPDGALQQFTYEVGGGGPPTTTISRNSEHVSWMPSYHAQRGGQRAKIIIDMVPQPAGWGRFFSGDKSHWRPQ